MDGYRLDSKHPIIQIQLNGRKMDDTGRGVAIGDTAEITFDLPGLVSYSLGTGLWEGNNRVLYFTLNGNVNVVDDSPAVLTFSTPTLAQVLTNFNSSRSYIGHYYDVSDVPEDHEMRFTFRSDCTWRFHRDGAFIESGSVTLVSWFPNSTYLEFQLCTNCDEIILALPASIFPCSNGPEWKRTIFYTAASE